MQNNRLTFSAILLLLFGLKGLQAQEAIPAAGGIAFGSGGSVSYSVGQVVYTSNTGTTGTIAHGVQQPFEISVVTGFEETDGSDLMVSAYPNPATDYLILKVKNFETLYNRTNHSTISYQLFNMYGTLLKSENLTGTETIIPAEEFIPATYFLSVSEGSKIIKTFKIVKK